MPLPSCVCTVWLWFCGFACPATQQPVPVPFAALFLWHFIFIFALIGGAYLHFRCHFRICENNRLFLLPSIPSSSPPALQKWIAIGVFCTPHFFCSFAFNYESFLIKLRRRTSVSSRGFSPALVWINIMLRVQTVLLFLYLNYSWREEAEMWLGGIAKKGVGCTSPPRWIPGELRRIDYVCTEGLRNLVNSYAGGLRNCCDKKRFNEHNIT